MSDKLTAEAETPEFYRQKGNTNNTDFFDALETAIIQLKQERDEARAELRWVTDIWTIACPDTYDRFVFHQDRKGIDWTMLTTWLCVIGFSCACWVGVGWMIYVLLT